MIRSRSVLFLWLLCAAPLASATPLAAQRVRGASLSGGSRTPLTRAFVLDFETEDDLVTPLANGHALSAAEFGRYVRISASGANAGAAIFDSTPGGPNDPSQDVDLLVGAGNVLILQNSQASAQSAPGIFDRPNDDQDGGSLVFDFETAEEPLELVLVDIDAGSAQTSRVTLRDAHGRARVYAVPAGWTGDLVADGTTGTGTLSLATLLPQPGFASTATATEDAGFDASRVVQLVVALGSSGAVAELRWSRRPALGIAASGRRVSAFDADRDVHVGSFDLPDAHDRPGCAVDSRRGLGYVTGSAGRVWIVDLATRPPSLAAGINPMQSTSGAAMGDMSISLDGRFLAVATDGFELTTFDLATRLEAGRGSAGRTCGTLDFADERTLVAGTRGLTFDRVVCFTLDESGAPTRSPRWLGLPDPWKVACPPGGKICLALSRSARRLVAFRIEDMVSVSVVDFSALGSTLAISPDGRRIVVFTTSRSELRSLDPLTGAIGGVSLLNLPFTPHGGVGFERGVFDPESRRVYMPNYNEIFVRHVVPPAPAGTASFVVPMLALDVALGSVPR